jgi:hypothetical protein
LGQNAFYKVKIKKMVLGKEGGTLALSEATTSTQNFGDKSVLEEIELHGVNSVPNNTFYGYTCRIKANLSSVTSIGATSFYKSHFYDGELNLPLVRTLGGASFAYSNITKITSLGEVTEIDARSNTGDWVNSQTPNVFTECRSLLSVNLPSSLKTLGVNAFANCIALVDMRLPDGLEVLGDFSLKGCSSLVVDYLPESLTTIGAAVFYLNKNMLDYIYLPNLTGTLGGASFAKTNIKGVKNLGAITTLGGSAVYYPSSYGAGPFTDCTELEYAILPETITSSTSGAAFKGCTSLRAIIILGSSPFSMAYQGDFDNTNDCPIYVPDASVESYKTATNWNRYADRIKPLSEYVES